MRIAAVAAMNSSLLGYATSFCGDVRLTFSVQNSPPLKVCGKQLHIVYAAAFSSSDGTVSCKSDSYTFGRRELMFATAASSLVPRTVFAASKDLNSILQEEITKVLSKGNAAGLLRLVFHDAGTFDGDEKTGGMNGSILYELERPENRGLKRSLKVLEKAKGEVDAIHPVSWADLIAAAGALAVRVCGGPEIPIQLGRIDADKPDPEGKLPEETFNVATMKLSFKRKGFSTQELVALSGAHTLGNKGFGDPSTFDNSYYKILVENPWSSSDGMSSMIGLPSDRALVKDDDCMRWISKYAADQDLFFEDFKKVYVKLVNSGATWKRSM